MAHLQLYLFAYLYQAQQNQILLVGVQLLLELLRHQQFGQEEFY
jgi:hypothetical protein